MGALDTLDRSMRSSRALATTSYNNALRHKATAGVGSVLTPSVGNSLAEWQNAAKYRNSYSLFSGWLFAAIDAIASEGASQPIKAGRMLGKNDNPKKLSGMKHSKASKASMTPHIAEKAANTELEIIEDHPVLKALQKPNPIQGRYQFVYSFLSNLCLTGWGYIVMDEDEEGNLQFYSLPTTWIKPNHEEGPFSRFKIVDPTKPDTNEGEDVWLDRSQVGFAHLPNPADPRSAYAPSSAQMSAIRINDHIQTSREMFFENGVFPSVIITMGRNPHPDVPAGIRPRLSPTQRRQVNNMIRKTMGSVANYGNPAIIDGMIESIERLSMTTQEMGWDKSEESVKKAILSVFRVHPFILAQELNVGGYAQATIIYQLFYDRVNCYLDMLSNVLTELNNKGEEEGLLIWLEKLIAVDQTQRNQMLKFARTNNDISQNEFRTELGYSPDEDNNESVINKAMITGLVTLLDKVGQGAIQNVQAIAVLEGLGLPTDMAKKIAGPKVKKPEPPPAAPPGGGFPPPKPGEKPLKPGEKPPKPGEEEETEETAEKALRDAIDELHHIDHGSNKRIARMVVDVVKDWNEEIPS